MSAFEIKRQIREHLARIHISEKFKAYCIKYLHELHAKESMEQSAIIEAQQKAYRACLQEIDNLVGLKTSSSNADGSQLSDEEYGQRRVKLLKEKSALEELLQDAGKRIEQQLKFSEETFEFASTARERFANGDAKTKKEMLVTFGSNLTLKDKKLSIEARKPFFILGESMSDAKPEDKPIEPENTGLSQVPNEAPAFVSPNVLAGLDDVRAYGYKARRAVALIYTHFRKEFRKLSDRK